MTLARRLASIIAVCLVVFLAVGCHKKVPQQAPAPPPPAAPAPPPPPPPPPTRAPSEEEVFARKSVDELSRELNDVFFDFNESAIREEAHAPLQRDADWLKK